MKSRKTAFFAWLERSLGCPAHVHPQIIAQLPPRGGCRGFWRGGGAHPLFLRPPIVLILVGRGDSSKPSKLNSRVKGFTKTRLVGERFQPDPQRNRGNAGLCAKFRCYPPPRSKRSYSGTAEVWVNPPWSAIFDHLNGFGRSMTFWISRGHNLRVCKAFGRRGCSPG